jgi:hypothetical protein
MGLQSLIDKPKELLELINECLKPKEIEKKQFGEVFTPMTLINEMLDKLPKDVWSNKNLKWLDPCVGMGNFMIAIYLRLMESLKKEIPDEKKRKKHILENMLYMCELNKKNCHIVKQIFNINNENKINLYESDYLIFDSKKRFKIDNFNIIVGNPPYQEVDDNNKSKGGTNLYTKFINKSFNLIKENGYLVYITPISWLGPSKNIQMGNDILHNIFLKYDLLYLNLNECKKYFNVGSTFSYYIIKKSITSNLKTEVLSEYKKEIVKTDIDFNLLFNYNFLPIHITENNIKLINKITSNKNKLIIERCRILDTSTKRGKEHLKTKKDDKFKYITYHTTSKTYYSDIKLDIYDGYKVLLNMAGYLKPALCSECNLTESKFYINVKNENEGNSLVKFLNSEEVNKFLELCKYSGFNSRPVIESITYNTLDKNDNIEILDNTKKIGQNI